MYKPPYTHSNYKTEVDNYTDYESSVKSQEEQNDTEDSVLSSSEDGDSDEEMRDEESSLIYTRNFNNFNIRKMKNK